MPILEVKATVRVEVSDSLLRELENGTYAGGWYSANTKDAYERFFKSNCFRNNGFVLAEFESKQVRQEDIS